MVFSVDTENHLKTALKLNCWPGEFTPGVYNFLDFTVVTFLTHFASSIKFWCSSDEMKRIGEYGHFKIEERSIEIINKNVNN